jgi:thiol-disulfide isomerase/thioredoxin
MAGEQKREKDLRHYDIPSFATSNHGLVTMSRHSAAVAGPIKWLGIGLLLLGVPASAETGRFPPSSVLLFVASWCAPCHSELGRLPAITRGAQPFRVLVVPFDDRPATLTMIEAVPAAQRWQPGREMKRRLAKELATETGGLPFSMAVDHHGRPCGTFRKGMDGASAEALVAQCSRQQN